MTTDKDLMNMLDCVIDSYKNEPIGYFMMGGYSFKVDREKGKYYVLCENDEYVEIENPFKEDTK